MHTGMTRIVWWVASAVVLVALLAIPPVALLAWGQVPDRVPTVAELSAGQVADVHLLPVALTLAAAGVWAYFLGAVALEGWALLRSRGRPSRQQGRGRRGGMRGLVGSLLGGVLLLPAGQAVAADGGEVVPISDTAVPGSSQASGQDDRGQSAAAQHRMVVAAPGQDTVWDIAQSQLGDGQRAGEIRQLNADLHNPLPDGASLPAGTHVHLPASPVEDEETSERDAIPATGGSATAGGDTVHTVEAGDHLWGIAQEHHGDGTQWRQVWEDNRDEIGSDPHLIHPGQQLTVASGDGGASPPDPGEQAPVPEEDGEERTPEPEPEAGPEVPEPEGDAGEAGGTGAGEDTSSKGEAGAGRELPQDTAGGESAAQDAGADDSDQVAGSVALAGVAVLAAGTVALVRRHRRMQHRTRRFGHRIATPDGRAAQTETELRNAEVPDHLAFVRQALQAAAAAEDQSHQARLPQVAAVCLTDQAATVHLAQPAVLPAPFQPAEGEGGGPAWQWTIETTAQLPQVDEQAPLPYPALACIGRTPSGEALVLVDLEQVGTVQVTGPQRRQVLRTLAVELTASEMAEHLQLALVGSGVAPAVEQLGVPERLVRNDTIADALPVLAAHHREQQRLLAEAGVDSLGQARLQPAEDDTWAPLIVAADVAEQGGEEALAELVSLIDQQPRTAAAIVISGQENTAVAGRAWELATGPGQASRVPGTEVEVVPEPLTDEQYADVLGIAHTAVHGPDIPAAVAPVPTSDPSPMSAGPVVNGYGEASGAVDPQPAAATGEENETAAEEPAGNVLARLAHDSSPLVPELAPEPVPEQPQAEDKQNGSGTVMIPGTEGACTPSGPQSKEATDYDLAPPMPGDGDDAEEDTHSAVAESTADTEGVGSAGDDGVEGPVVRLLGPVEITGARGAIDSNRRRPALEAAAWIALNPGADREAMDEALWPGRRVDKQVRGPRVTQVRNWLGRDEQGAFYLPHIQAAASRGLALSEGVRCDWTWFQQLASRGRAASNRQDGDRLMRQALALVRGRPFSGVGPRRYVWAEHLAQDMIAEVVDTAAELAERCLQRLDPRGGLWAATRGLAVAPEAEMLHRLVFRAQHALGDAEGLERSCQILDDLLAEWQVDMEPETAQILRQLMAEPATTPVATSGHAVATGHHR